MKRLKRKFVQATEIFNFGVKKGSVAERYFDTTRLNLGKTNKINFYLEYGFGTPPKNAILYLIYIDTKFNEFVIEYKKDIPVKESTNKKEHHIKIPVLISTEGKTLYKIKLENLPTTECRIDISISEL